MRKVGQKGRKDDGDESVDRAEEDRPRGLGKHEEFQGYGCQEQSVKGASFFLEGNGHRQHGSGSEKDGNDHHSWKHGKNAIQPATRLDKEHPCLCKGED